MSTPQKNTGADTNAHKQKPMNTHQDTQTNTDTQKPMNTNAGHGPTRMCTLVRAQVRTYVHGHTRGRALAHHVGVSRPKKKAAPSTAAQDDPTSPSCSPVAEEHVAAQSHPVTPVRERSRPSSSRPMVVPPSLSPPPSARRRHAAPLEPLTAMTLDMRCNGTSPVERTKLFNLDLDDPRGTSPARTSSLARSYAALSTQNHCLDSNASSGDHRDGIEDISWAQCV